MWYREQSFKFRIQHLVDAIESERVLKFACRACACTIELRHELQMAPAMPIAYSNGGSKPSSVTHLRRIRLVTGASVWAAKPNR